MFDIGWDGRDASADPGQSGLASIL